jgi:hypothetical protein
MIQSLLIINWANKWMLFEHQSFTRHCEDSNINDSLIDVKETIVYVWKDRSN